MTTPAKLTTFSGQERTVTSNPYMTRLTLSGKTHYSCNFCKIYFLSSTCCIRHIMTHTGEKPFSCSYCNKAFSRKSTAQIHERVHTGEKPFSCSYCSQSFARKYTAQVHEKIHTGTSPLCYEACGLSFSSSSHLNYHRKQIKNISCSVSGSNGTQPNLNSAPTHYSCNFCKIHFLSSTSCIRHIRTHTGEKPFSCSYCNQSFARKYTAQVHERTHTGEKPISCGVCGLSFSSSAHLNYHRKQKKNIACSASRSGSTGTRSNLIPSTTSKLIVAVGPDSPDQHLQMATETNTSSSGSVGIATVKHVKVQTGDRPYTCKYSYCSKTFALRGNAKAHERTHLGVNSFHCSVCSKGFRSNFGLKYHLTKSKISKCSTDVIRRADSDAVQITKPFYVHLHNN